MGFLSRVFGICQTKPPADGGCWRYGEGKIEIELPKAPELEADGGAIRIEGDDLPLRVLVLHGYDGEFHAYHNRCSHAGRRIDPLPESRYVQCCSVGRSMWNYEGESMAGPGKESLTAFPVRRDGTRLVVEVSEVH